MGSKERTRAEQLPAKLLAIRKALDLSQNQLLEKLGIKDQTVRSTISAFERGTREPSYPLLLKYARLAGISTDMLIDDDLKLKLPSK